MHFEILVEDQSGKATLDNLVPKIIGNNHTFKVHSYKGIGHIPKNLNSKSEASKRILLDQLPKLLRGYGRTFANYPIDYPSVVFLICDLDDKCLKAFRQDLLEILNACNPKPNTRFCIAIEEGEAWFLGDIAAIKQAYPKAKSDVLNSYVNDSTCGTWERLADAIYPGGSRSLKAKGWRAIGSEKSTWANIICPYMNVNSNDSPSFNYFKTKILELMEVNI